MLASLPLPYRIKKRDTGEEGTVLAIKVDIFKPGDDIEVMSMLVVAWDYTDDEDGNPRPAFDIVANDASIENLGIYDPEDFVDSDETDNEDPQNEPSEEKETLT